MNIEVWGNDGERDFKICDVSSRQYGAIIIDALALAQRSGRTGFAVTHLWQRDMSDPRHPVMLDHEPIDKSAWGNEI